MLRALVTEDCGIYCGASRTAENRLFAKAVLKGNGKVEYKIICGEVLLIGDIVAVALKLEAIFRFGKLQRGFNVGFADCLAVLIDECAEIFLSAVRFRNAE